MFCPIALQLYSVRNELQKDFPGTLAQVKEMGYDGVELAGLCGYSPEQVKKCAKKPDWFPSPPMSRWRKCPRIPIRP